MAIATDFNAQNLIDEEIVAEVKRHKEHIKALNIRRNTYCAVNQLPDDVLRAIFLFVKLEAEASCPYTAFGPDTHAQWVVLLRVCHAWHDQIVGDPQFWTRINLNSPHASKMLVLSKAALLSISVMIPTDVGDSLCPLIDRLISQGPRLRELWMDLPDHTALSKVLTPISSNNSASLLERLTISVERDTGHFSGAAWFGLSSLRSLSLFGAPLPSHAHFESMPHLTHLGIGGIHIDHCATIPWLLSTLKCLPNIQKIIIFGLRGPGADPNFQPVTLPRLQFLQLSSSDASTLSIFNKPIIPTSPSLQIFYERVRIDALRVADISGLKSAISKVISSAMSMKMVSVMLNKDLFELAVHIGHDDHESTHLPQPSFLCWLPCVAQEDMHVLLRLCALIPFAEAPTLSLEGLTANNGHTFIRSSPKMVTLILRNCDIQMLRLLFKSKYSPQPPNPELRCIRFHKACFRNKRGHKNGMYVALRDILQERKLYEMSIRNLTFEECDMTDSQVKYLQELVEVVRVRYLLE
ncbi:hypothetical protein ONZ45_g3060 [Pleurotus djamor]|nr:hypothetical protein ONZ45_g3060 [Pleurotus djamor]